MSSSYSLQFVDLCRIQLMSLNNNLGAELGIIYVTKSDETAQEQELEPLISFPENANDQWIDPLATGKFLTGTISQKDVSCQAYTVEQPEIEQVRQYPPQRLLQPLAHEDIMVGLLLAMRTDRPWQEPERLQIEQIGQTIAIAAIIDRERQWAIRTIHKQQQFQSRQQKILDNLLHQLRNPLTAIYTFGKLLLKKIPAADPNRQIVANILSESEHLKELLQRLDNGPQERQITAVNINLLAEGEGDLQPQFLPLLKPANLQLQLCNIAEILEPILANGAALAQEKQLIFHSTIPLEIPLVMASASALREILGNLVDNALKYTLQGEIQVTVSVVNQQLLIVISDSGVGIPATDLPQLFQRSYRGSQVYSNIPGTGLGLSIAKDLAEQMGGTITVISPLKYDHQGLGSGCKFTFTLPIA
jgi:signal transduction histidine kinase